MNACKHKVRILDINIDKIINQIESAGGNHFDVLYEKIYVSDINPPQKSRWIQLHSSVGEIAKPTLNEIIDNRKEKTEIIVSNFNDVNTFLIKLGFISRSLQENIRIMYKLNGVSINLEIFPMIPTHMMIEGNSRNEINEVLKILEIDSINVTMIDIETVYSEKYDINLENIAYLTFSESELNKIKDLISNMYPHKVNILHDIAVFKLT